MPYYNIAECNGNQAPHVHAPCPGGQDAEFGRIRRSGFIKSGYLATVITGAANPSTWLQVWQTGIDNGDIIVLPETRGSFDPGTPAELSGFGDRPSTNGPRTMVLSVSDPDYTLNYEFYNNLAKYSDLVPYYVTSKLIHIFDKVCTAFASDPVEDDLNSQVVWQFQATVISDNLPKFWQATSIKPAIEYTPSNTPVVYDSVLEFTTEVTDDAAGITGTVTAVDPDIKFQFNAITAPVQPGTTMAIYVGGTEPTDQEITVTFPGDYVGRAFRYIDANGVSHSGVFQVGNVNF